MKPTPRNMIVYFVLAYLYRIGFALALPQPIIHDQNSYIEFARKMLDSVWVTNPTRTYGFPFLIIPLLVFFGTSDPMLWISINSAADSLVAVMVVLMAYRYFNVRVALLAGIIYLFNPFTTSYVGVLLTEIPVIFIVTLLLFVFPQLYSRNRWLLLLGIGIYLGFLPQVKTSFMFWAWFYILALIYGLMRLKTGIKNRIVLAAVLVFSGLTPYTYNLVTNLKLYNTVSLTTIDNFFIREVYTSLFVDRIFNVNVEDKGTFMWPGPVLSTWAEYAQPQDATGRRERDKKYLANSLEIIKRDVPAFIISRINKMYFVWDKTYILPYKMWWTRDPLVVMAMRIVNIVILGFGLYGLGLCLKAEGKCRRLAWIFFSLVLYITFGHIFSTSEERYSLPAYPVMILFCAYGISKAISVLGSSKWLFRR